MPSSWTHERAKLANLIRHRPDDAEAIATARRDLRAARLEDHVTKVLADAPPLTDEQRSRLSAILRGNGAGDA